MRIIAWIRVGIMWIRELRRLKHASKERAAAISNGTFSDAATIGGRDFDEKYRSAMRLVQQNIDQKFPDPYYAKQHSGYDKNVSYSSQRIDAIDAAPSIVAKALRAGSTIAKAAELAEVSLVGSPSSSTS